MPSRSIIVEITSPFLFLCHYLYTLNIKQTPHKLFVYHTSDADVRRKDLAHTVKSNDQNKDPFLFVESLKAEEL